MLMERSCYNNQISVINLIWLHKMPRADLIKYSSCSCKKSFFLFYFNKKKYAELFSTISIIIVFILYAYCSMGVLISVILYICHCYTKIKCNKLCCTKQMCIYIYLYYILHRETNRNEVAAISSLVS